MNSQVNRVERESKKRIAVIGGGWSGLYALKSSCEDGHSVVLFEQSDGIGGVWQYNEHKPGGVWRDAHTTSSKTYLHASDFPMPDHYPLFPHHSYILKYLYAYVDHFDLWPHICLKHTVENVIKVGDEWQVTVTSNKHTEILFFDAVIVCTGQNQIPSYPDDAMYKQFLGITMHSYEYKYPLEEMHDKIILVIGGGESASDIATEVSQVARHVYMSIRQGQWFQPRQVGARLALDTRFSRKGRLIMGNYGENRLALNLADMVFAFGFGEGGHGIKEWLPTWSILNGFVNKSREVLDKIVLGGVSPKRGVRNIHDNYVWFEGEEEPVYVDMIIFATGFQQTLPFLDSPRPSTAYKYVFDPDDPTLAYVGGARPVFGSIPALSELQARWVSAVFSGRCHLPSREAMYQEIESDRVKHRKWFPANHDRMPSLVSHFAYSDYLLDQLNARPDFWHLFWTDRKKWWLLLSAPWTPFESLVNDPVKGDTAYQNIRKEQKLKKRAPAPSLFKLIVGSLGLIALSSVSLVVLLNQLYKKVA